MGARTQAFDATYSYNPPGDWTFICVANDGGAPTWIAKKLCVPEEEAPVEQNTVQGIQPSLLVLVDDLAESTSVTRIRVGLDVGFDVGHRVDEALQSFLRIAKQFLSRNHQLLSRIRRRAPH